MKTKFNTLITILAFTLVSGSAFSQVVSDTTVRFNNKSIHLTDSADQVKVRVYKTDTAEYKQIYEGIFTDDQSFESYSVSESFGLNLPFPGKKPSSRSGFEIKADDFKFGLVYPNSKFNFNDENALLISSANEFNWQPVLVVKKFDKSRIGLTSGLGMTWRNYHIGGNRHLFLNNDVVTAESAPANIFYTYSRLRTFELNVPVMFEWHPSAMKGFHISTGIIAGFNVFSSYKVKYRDPDTNKKVKEVLGKHYQINPFSFNYLLQIGYKDVSIYGKFTPTSIFKKDKGPELQTLSLGLALSF